MPEAQLRPDVVRAIGVFCAAYRFDSLKLMREVNLHWPDATASEVDAAFVAADAFTAGGADD